MARARPPRTPTPGQLTLEDWRKMLEASPETQETPCREATSVDAPVFVGAPTNGQQAQAARAATEVEAPARHHPVATVLLKTPGALLTRSHLRELGFERRAVDAVFRALPVVALPGYSRPMIRVQDYLELLEHRTLRDDRVRPMARAS